jgi:hypothetical protein
VYGYDTPTATPEPAAASYGRGTKRGREEDDSAAEDLSYAAKKSKRSSRPARPKKPKAAKVIGNVRYSELSDSTEYDVARAFVLRGTAERQLEAKKHGEGRPLNCFFLYRKAYRQLVKERENVKQDNKISERVGAAWNAESLEVRRLFTELYRVEKEEHRKAFPEYKYEPKNNQGKRKGARKAPKRGAASKRRQLSEATDDIGNDEHENPEYLPPGHGRRSKRFRSVGPPHPSSCNPATSTDFAIAQHAVTSPDPTTFAPNAHAPQTSTLVRANYDATFGQPELYWQQHQYGNQQPAMLPPPYHFTGQQSASSGYQPTQQLPPDFSFDSLGPAPTSESHEPYAQQRQTEGGGLGGYEESWQNAVDPALADADNRLPTPKAEDTTQGKGEARKSDEESCIYVAPPPEEDEIPSSFLDQDLGGEGEQGEYGLLGASFTDWELRHDDEEWAKTVAVDAE